MFFKKRRRRKLMRRAFPPEWSEIIRRNVPYCARLSDEDRGELHGLIHVFLDEKRFEGAGGLEITEEIRLTIAAQACVLLLRRSTDIYPKLRSIIVYPRAYAAESKRRNPDGTVWNGVQVRLGESWSYGAVVLSWDDVLRGASDIHDGRNVVLHEFAHQLDQEATGSDGAPPLPERSMYIAWARVLGGEYEELIRSIESGKPTIIDGYGAASPAEFFAVVTEFFFERPRLLRSRYPNLYEQFRLFYRQDPAELAPAPRNATDR
ncbi:MAG: M90 family metallopeptidase [Candidatus Eisenbacteria bacterium]